LLLAAVAHDVGHLGQGTHFLVETCAPLATTYNDRSPLENLHACIFFETLRRPDLNFLETMGSEDFQMFRSKVISAILSTDMAHHFEFVDRFGAQAARMEDIVIEESGDRAFCETDASRSDRRMLLNASLQMADLGNTCRTWAIHKHVSALVEAEGFAQGDMERERGIPVTPLLDRNKSIAAEGQVGFMDNLVFPLLEPYCVFLVSNVRQLMFHQHAENAKRWASLVAQHEGSNIAQLIQLEDSNAFERALKSCLCGRVR